MVPSKYLALILICAHAAAAFRILVLPAPAGCSHVLLMHRISEGLAARGHEILVGPDSRDCRPPAVDACQACNSCNLPLLEARETQDVGIAECRKCFAVLDHRDGQGSLHREPF